MYIEQIKEFTEISLLILFSLLLGVALLTMLRFLGKFPSELDRIGSDLNLYGYGIVLSFLFAIEAGRPVLRCFRQEWIPLISGVALVTTLILYGFNLYISKQIRNLNVRRYAEGLEDWEHLTEVLQDKTGRALFKASLMLGFLPTLALILLDTAG